MYHLIKRLHRTGLLVALAICIASFQGCAPAPQSDVSNTDDKILIGFSMATLKEDRWLQDRDIFTAKAKQAGFDVIVKNANNDSQLQYEQVADMIKSGINVLVIVPHDSEDAARAVALAKKAGIPVISYDRLVRDADVDVYISFNNVRVGQVMGEAIKKAVPEGGYIILNGSENDNNSEMFSEGYKSIIQDSIDSGKIKILGETWVKDWRRETAYDYVYGILQEKGDQVNAIIAANDSLAWAAIDALSVEMLTDKVKVVGHDADLAACQRIVEGTQLLTVYKPIKYLVDKTLETCTALVKKQKITADSTIDNGLKEIPYIMIDVIPVTKDNIDETVIKDGFHLKEDVYRSK